jgi:hypothetical protein
MADKPLRNRFFSIRRIEAYPEGIAGCAQGVNDIEGEVLQSSIAASSPTVAARRDFTWPLNGALMKRSTIGLSGMYEQKIIRIPRFE